MDSRTGKIYQVTEEEHARLTKEVEDHNRRSTESQLTGIKASINGTVVAEQKAEEALTTNTLVPLTENEARFLRTKGMAFRQLWGKKMLRGLKAEERDLFDQLVNQHNMLCDADLERLCTEKVEE